MKKAVVLGITLAMGMAGSAIAGKGPQMGVAGAAYCGTPVAVGADGEPYLSNVGLELINNSSEPALFDDKSMAQVVVHCLWRTANSSDATGKGRGKEGWATVEEPATLVVTPSSSYPLGYGKHSFTCPEPPAGAATSWRAAVDVTWYRSWDAEGNGVTGSEVTKSFSCAEEIFVN